MHLTAIFAQLCCRDLEVGIAWFSALFARPPDARPMDGLAEWHHGAEAGLQLRLAPDHAGHGTLTLIVPDLAAQRRGLNLLLIYSSFELIYSSFELIYSRLKSGRLAKELI